MLHNTKICHKHSKFLQNLTPYPPIREENTHFYINLVIKASQIKWVCWYCLCQVLPFSNTHLINLIRQHNISVLVLSKSIRVQQLGPTQGHAIVAMCSTFGLGHDIEKENETESKVGKMI